MKLFLKEFVKNVLGDRKECLKINRTSTEEMNAQEIRRMLGKL